MASVKSAIVTESPITDTVEDYNVEHNSHVKAYVKAERARMMARVRAMTVEEFANHIRRYRMAANETMVRDGRVWYSGMAAIMHAHADSAPGIVTAEIAAGLYACASINNSWSANLKLASRWLDDMAHGIMPHDGHTEDTVSKAARIAAGESLDDVIVDKKNFKIRSFTRNLLADVLFVTVDRWAWRVATDWTDCPRRDGCSVNSKTGNFLNGKHGCGIVPDGKLYQTIADAYRMVAKEFNEDGLVTQAITWCVVRGTGE